MNFSLLFVCFLADDWFHFPALVHMKALRDRCVAEEEVISHLSKHNETLTNEQGQYKEALIRR